VAALSFRGVGHRYPGASRPSLSEVELEIEDGELVLLLGASGSGKSTLLRAALGLVPHFHGGALSGTVLTGGLDTRDHPPAELARRAGLVFQDPEAQLVLQRAEREAAFGLENLGHPAGEIGFRAREALMVTGASRLADRLTTGLSGGEQQRVAIASVIAMGQPILLLDEPTSQLDPVAAEELLGLIVRINRDRGTTVVLAEHRTGRIFAEADRVVVMDAGRIVVDAPPARAARQLAATHPWLLPPVTQAFAQAGWATLPLTVKEARAQVELIEPTRAHTARQPGSGAVELRGIAKRLGGIQAVAGATTGFDRGRVTAVLGENGAGKTTLMRIACGLLAADAGRVDAPTRAAYVSQNPAHHLLRETVSAEVGYALENLGVGVAERDRRVADELERLGLAGLADRHPRDLSSGERQRLAIASVTVMRPGLLVLDEPTRGLDGRRKLELVGLLRELAADGTAVAVVAHDIDFAAECADAVTAMAGGTVLTDRGPRDLLARSAFFVSQVGLALGRVSVAEGAAALMDRQAVGV
jgi:energy-coupling factor transport system ATP-binding protein